MALQLHTLRSGKQYPPTGLSMAPSRQLTAAIQEWKKDLVNLNLHWRGPPTIFPDTSFADQFLVGAWLSCPKKIIYRQKRGSMPVDEVVTFLKNKLKKYGAPSDKVERMELFPPAINGETLRGYIERWYPDYMVKGSFGCGAMYPVVLDLKVFQLKRPMQDHEFSARLAQLQDVSPSDDDSESDPDNYDTDEDELPEPPTKRPRQESGDHTF